MCHVSHAMCHVSHVTCHMSNVMCYMSCVTCHVSHDMCHMPKKKLNQENSNEQSAGASLWRVCYQLGLPRLAYIYTLFLTTLTQCDFPA